MSWKYRKILEFLGLRPKAPPPRVFVSLNVFSGHHSSRLSHPSTRVIVRVSVWTLIVLLLAFLIVYTSLLLYVDNNFLQKSSMRIPGRHKKMKLTGRLKLLPNRLNKDQNILNHGSTDVSHRKAVWNSSIFHYDPMNSLQCKQQTVFRVLIASAPSSKSHRQAIRDSWCEPDNVDGDFNRWHCIFLVGLSKHHEINEDIRKENEENNDILFGHYFDAYENLTLKVIHGLNWTVNNCPSSFIIKTDEDCFVNTALVHKFLVHDNKITDNLYAGRIVREKRKLKVKRLKGQRWFVPFEDFQEEYYYPYASGMGYIVSKDVAARIVRESAFIKPIVNEDAYIGIVIHHLGIEPTSSNRFLLSPLGLNICNHAYLFVIHDVPPEKQKEILNKTIRAREECNDYSTLTAWS